MTKTRLGGIKVIENRALLTRTSWWRDTALADVCAHLADNRINILLLTHIKIHGQLTCGTMVCTDLANGYTSFAVMKSQPEPAKKVRFYPHVDILTLFPHQQRGDIIGTLFHLLHNREITPYGVASSPSALCVTLPPGKMAGLIEALFDPFEFPAYHSPQQWHAAYQGREQMLREIICSYQEQMIKVYNVVLYKDLEFFTMVAPVRSFPELASGLEALAAQGFTLPFFAALTQAPEELSYAFCVTAKGSSDVGQILARLFPDRDLGRYPPVAAFFIQGPHFGDRYGIASVLADNLRQADINPLAVSCTVATISVVVNQDDLERSLTALRAGFLIPDS